MWGKAMVVAIIVALLTSWRRSDNATRVLLVYIVVFGSVFLVFQTRIYWYNAVFPAVILLVARFVSDMSESAVKYLSYRLKQGFIKQAVLVPHMRSLSCILMILLTVVLLFVPYKNTARKVHANWLSPITPLEMRADYAAHLWIESHLLSHSSILVIGRHAINLPRLIADKPDVQAIWGEYFAYRRDENPAWRKVYESAYSQLQQKEKQTYRIVSIRERYSNSPYDLEINALYRKNMVNIALDSGCKFIVSASPKAYKVAWGEDQKVELLAYFNQSTGHHRDEVKIFKVLQ